MKGSRVRVREGRAGRELIVDGTFASFYRPGNPATGSVWDAIVAPLLALPAERRTTVLILGLGGGSAARIVRAIAPAARIVGVELDPEVLEAARGHFGLDELGVEVVADDALAFLKRDTGRYDVVFEDVFVGEGDDVHKPDWLPHPALALAARRVAPGGLLVSNTLDEAPAVAGAMQELYPNVLRIDVDGYDNRIFAGGASPCTARELRQAVKRSEILGASTRRLAFRTLKSAR